MLINLLRSLNNETIQPIIHKKSKSSKMNVVFLVFLKRKTDYE